MHPADRDPFSWRTDASVPDFDDSMPIAVIDGACPLCTFGAWLIDRFDYRGEFRICPVRSELGTALLRHYGLDPESPESWLVIIDGRAYGSMEGVIQAGSRIGGPMGLFLQPATLMPRMLQDWIYQRVARNRLSFGDANLCEVAPLSLRKRLIG